MIMKFVVSQILLDGRSLCDIMYLKLFKKMKMEQSRLLEYEGSDIQEFNWTTTRP